MSKEKDSGVKVVHKLEPLKVRKQAYKVRVRLASLKYTGLLSPG